MSSGNLQGETSQRRLLPAGVKPYYEEDGIAIVHGDCRELLPLFGVVDLALTDPPYGIGLDNHDKTGKFRSSKTCRIVGDNDISVGTWALKFLEDIDCAVIAFASPHMPWPGEWRQRLVWSKGGAVGGGGDISTCWKFDWELIQVARTGKLNGARDSSVLRYSVTPADLEYHPAQKPLPLLSYLIRKSTEEGDTLIDPFMGSGSTLLSAKNMGRRAIGIEIEEKYCEIAAKRLSQGVLDLEVA